MLEEECTRMSTAPLSVVSAAAPWAACALNSHSGGAMLELSEPEAALCAFVGAVACVAILKDLLDAVLP